MSVKMKKVVSRKLFLFGKYSLALLPPKKWLNKLGIKKGDTVDIKLDSSKRRLIIQFESRSHKETIESGKEKKSTKNGWEPIPRL